MTYWFPKDYVESRERFLAHCKNHNFSVTSLKHPATGPRGEALYVDFAVGGKLGSEQGIVHLIGTHGIEAYIGSGIQNEIFNFLGKCDVPELPRMVFIHPVNPYGMAWHRRTNHNNVDLNRNYRAQTFEPPDSRVYAELQRFINPRSRLAFATGWLALARAYLRHGRNGIKQGMAQGQYLYPKGLFYGGAQNEPEVDFLKNCFHRHCADLKEIWAVEVHTGLGEWTVDMMIADPEDGAEAHELMREVYDYPIVAPSTEQNSYKTYGKLSDALRESTSGQLRYALQEFGTYPDTQVLLNSRAENYFHHYGANPEDLDHPLKQAFRESFFPNSEEWRRETVERGLKRFKAVLNYLSQTPRED